MKKKKKATENIHDSDSDEDKIEISSRKDSDKEKEKEKEKSTNTRALYPNDISEDPESEANENDPAHSRAAYQIISQLSQLLTDAQEQFLLPSRTSFPITYQGQQHFDPPLPKELLIDFKIKNSMLHVSAAFLKLSTQPNPTPSPKQKQQDERKLIHSLQGNHYYEIVEQESVDHAAKKFSTIFCFLRDSAVICDELKDKLSVHF